MKDRCSARQVARILGGTIAIASIALILSCSGEGIASFTWKSSLDQGQVFSQTAHFPKGQENLFSQARPQNSFMLRKAMTVEPGFMIAASVNVKRDGLGIGFSLSPEGKKAGREVRFAAKPGRMTFYLNPPDSRNLKTFSISLFPLKGGSMDAKDETPLVELESVSTLPSFVGFEQGKAGGDRISDGISFEASASGTSKWTLGAPFASSLAYAKLESDKTPGRGQESVASALVIAYEANAEADIVIESGKGKMLAKCASALKRILIPASAFSGAASLERITLSVPRGVKLSAAYVEAIASEAAATVDPGVMLLEPPLSADQDFAWYRWDLLPEVIMFDFRNYATQDAYLKRLAFFVEKKGFAGNLASDNDIAALHGWNAHDYKTDDLARFFSTAEKTGFQLNPEELRLRDFLVEKKLLERRGKEYLGLSGAIISISQESPPYLRHTFLTHESSHAVFFADARYRQYCVSMWNAMSKEEKWFWILYFGWMNYDTSSAYLMASEMQAYLTQQPPQNAEEYFTKTLVERLLERHPELEAPLAAYMGAFGKEFANKAGMLDRWLRTSYGFGAGTTFFLR